MVRSAYFGEIGANPVSLLHDPCFADEQLALPQVGFFRKSLDNKTSTDVEDLLAPTARENPMSRVSHRLSLRMLPKGISTDQAALNNELRALILSFASTLQKRYPFDFGPGRRGVEGDHNRKTQEKLVTHYILVGLIECSDFEPKKKENALKLSALLVQQIGSGGENFVPSEFTENERVLAQSVGGSGFSQLIGRSKELAQSFDLTMGPVNSTEHSVCWSFRYLAQFLKAAEWESVER